MKPEVVMRSVGVMAVLLATGTLQAGDVLLMDAGMVSVSLCAEGSPGSWPLMAGQVAGGCRPIPGPSCCCWLHLAAEQHAISSWMLHRHLVSHSHSRERITV